jgi:formiminoglutamase
MKLGKYVTCREGDSQLVLSMPHSGRIVPDDIGHKLDLSKEHVRRTINTGHDLCVPFVTGACKYTSATLIETSLSTEVVNCNRAAENVDQYSVHGSEGVNNPHGLIIRATFEFDERDIKPILAEPYTQDELQHILDEAHTPYVNAERDQVQRVKELHGRAIIFGLHSMPCAYPSSVEEGMYKNGYVFKRTERGPVSEGKLPDLVILTRPGKCSPDLPELLTQVFGDHGMMIDQQLKVAPKTTTSPLMELGKPDEGVHALGIEVVGHTFEPRRMEGELVYNPKGQERYQAAFKDVFRALEAYKG